MKRIQYIILCITAMISASCISNDLPYPKIQANIVYISAEGETSIAEIDTVNRTVSLYFGESANIYDVHIDSLTLTPGASVVHGDLYDGIDLSSPYEVTLALYQDYAWQIIGVQDIERYFTVEGQVGTSVINAENRTVEFTVTKKTALAAVNVLTCKLGTVNSVVKPDLQDKFIDFTQPVDVDVETYGHIERWTLIAQQAESDVETVSADGWTCVGWVYGQAEAGRENTVQYRIKGDTEWLTVPKQWLKEDGGSFCARITGLQPLTLYEARAVSGDVYGEVLEFTTGAKVQIPNSDFDEWWLDGKVWNPWPKGGEQVWDTGNKGAATLGQSNSVPTDDTVDGTGRAAMLQTKFVGIGMLGKLAAGNIFVGKFVRTDGTNGVLSLGREFKERPTKLTGYMKYKTAPISSTTAGFADLKGRPDTCVIWCALIDTDEPLEIRTNPSNRQLFDPAGDYVVAYGKVESGEDIPAYKPFEIELQYTSTSRVPKYILITASASKYGDYFTGGNGAVLYVDDFRLHYDY